MKALTLWRPWPAAIFYLGKDVENRTWPPPASIIGKRIAIHASKKEDKDALSWMLQTLKPGMKDTMRLLVLMESHDVKGAIVGTVVVDSWRNAFTAGSRWAVGPYCWMLKDPIVLAEPITCKGAQGLWNVPEPIVAEMGPFV